jgi:hypothetical protein
MAPKTNSCQTVFQERSVHSIKTKCCAGGVAQAVCPGNNPNREEQKYCIFHLYEVPKTGKLIETERIVVTKARGRREGRANV